MHISAKILLIFSSLGLLAGIAGMVFGGVALGEVEPFAIEGKEGTVELHDDDGKGEIGFKVWMKGKYVDADGNEQWDDCEAVAEDIKFFNSSGDNRFIPTCSDGARSNDNGQYNIKNFHDSDDGLIYVGIACNNEVDSWLRMGKCADETYTLNSTVDVKVEYVDEVMVDAGGGILGLLGGGALICCAGIFFVIGLVLAFTIKDKELYPEVMAMDQSGMMTVQIPAQQAVPTITPDGDQGGI